MTGCLRGSDGDLRAIQRAEQVETPLTKTAGLVSGALLLLSYPPYDLSFLAWVALTPLLWRALSRPGTRAVAGGALTAVGGFLWGAGLFYPLLFVEEGTAVERVGGFLLIGLITALVLSLFDLLAQTAARTTCERGRWFLVPLLASAWVCVEYLVRTLVAGFSTYLGVTQWQASLPLILASYGGIYAVAWLIVAVNAALVTVGLALGPRAEGKLQDGFLDRAEPPPPKSEGSGAREAPGRSEKRKRLSESRLSHRGSRDWQGSRGTARWVFPVLGAATLWALLSGGHVGPLNRFEPPERIEPQLEGALDHGGPVPAGLQPGDQPLQVVLVQPHFTPALYREARDEMEAQRGLWRNALAQARQALESASGPGATLVVLPETVVHYPAWGDPAFRESLARLAREKDVHWLVGLPRAQARPTQAATAAPTAPGRLDESLDLRDRNAALWVEASGEGRFVYDKIYVIPVAESQFAPGRRPGFIEIAGRRLGVGICSDVVVPDHALATVRAGAESLHYIASLAHIGEIAWLERAFVSMRAAEHGVTVTQTATTGPTLIVDGRGRLVAGAERGEPAVLVAKIEPRSGGPTLYTRWGDWVVFVSAVWVLTASFGTGGRRLER